jgi:uncharacterized protein (DUF697 family)/GTP-binding protein EngB required for normal cell division
MTDIQSEDRREAPSPTTAYAEASADARRRYGRFNLAIVGGTGVGKSSLVNAVFGRELATVGRGLPVTRGVHYYHDDSLGIWDFEGFEIGSDASPAEALRENLATISRRPADEQISVVWYCVTANSDRLTRPDISMIRELAAAGLPVILVLTKAEWTRNPLTGSYRLRDDQAGFARWLEAPVDEAGIPIDLPVRRVIATSVQDARGRFSGFGPFGKRGRPRRHGLSDHPDQFDAHGKGAGHGLGELVTETLALSPHREQDAFRIAQRLNLEWKREMARPVIAAACAAAAVAAAVPIPVADAVTLAPIQMAMMGRISAIYDLELQTMLSTQALAQLSAQTAGQALAHSLVKLIPVAGSVLNASVASAITAAAGNGWMRLCEGITTGRVNPARIADAVDDFSPTLVSVLKNLGLRKITRG